jgi:hypothetical protein
MTLLHKLKRYLYLLKIIASFLSSHSFQVSVNKTDSATHPIPYGVPQGANRSSPEQRKWNFQICGWYCGLCVQQRSRSGLKYTGNDTSYSKQWKIKINAAKTQALYLTRCWSPRSCRLLISGLGPSYSMVYRSKIPWGYPQEETHIRR